MAQASHPEPTQRPSPQCGQQSQPTRTGVAPLVLPVQHQRLWDRLRYVQDGSVHLLGSELNGAPEDQLVLNRQRLGFIFQAHNLHESLTAMQSVRMGLEVHGRETMVRWRPAAVHLLTMLGLGDHLDYSPSNLSGGQMQRVAVARALIGNPDIVFADEPTAALDKDSGRQVVSLLKRLGQARNTTTLMVTHDNRILELADRIITMEDGRIVRDKV